MPQLLLAATLYWYVFASRVIDEFLKKNGFTNNQEVTHSDIAEDDIVTLYEAESDSIEIVNEGPWFHYSNVGRERRGETVVLHKPTNEHRKITHRISSEESSPEIVDVCRVVARKVVNEKWVEV